jgi:hypothetical protein
MIRKCIPLVILALTAMTMTAGQSIRIIPTPKSAEVDGSAEMSVKRMPEGGTFKLAVNKDQNVSYYTIKWFKDGMPIVGAEGQELTYPIATQDLAGVYTVELSSPCASVMSKPMQVIVENRSFQVNSEINTGSDVVAGHMNEIAESGYTLRECQPNPVTDQARIEFVTGSAAPVTLKVVDLNGNTVATLVNDMLPAGEHSVTINTREHNMANALYYYVLTAPGYTATKPMMLVK